MTENIPQHVAIIMDGNGRWAKARHLPKLAGHRVGAKAVRQAIEHHVGLKRRTKLEPVEAACLWDADKLSKIGAASLIHFGCIAGAFEPVDTAGILQRGRAWLEHARTIAASMNTKPGRKEAERRAAERAEGQPAVTLSGEGDAEF